VWNLNANLTIVANTAAIPAGQYYMLIQDNTSTPNEDGFHSLDSNGIPYGIVYANTAVQAGTPWSVVLSHEILEM
jgi:hypothetical protein